MDKHQAAVELGRLGGLKGGRVRAARMTAEERSEAARVAVEARIKKYGQRRRGKKEEEPQPA